jgi:hypothetical protein
MLPLSAETTPTTVSELADALRRGFQEQKLSPVKIDADGADLSSVKKLHIDLSGTHLTREFRPPNKEEAGKHIVEAASFELLGAPVYFEKAPLEIRLVATGVRGGMDIKEGHGSLVVISAASGSVSVETPRVALETLLHSLAVEMAAKQGFEVRKTTLTFTQEGPRAVTFRAEVTAKVFVMSASLALTGRLTVDDALNARISNLALDGDGMILKLAAGFARPHLDRLEGRTFPLLTFTPAGLSLRDVEMTVGETLRASAHFGVA